MKFKTSNYYQGYFFIVEKQDDYFVAYYPPAGYSRGPAAETPFQAIVELCCQMQDGIDIAEESEAQDG